MTRSAKASSSTANGSPSARLATAAASAGSGVGPEQRNEHLAHVAVAQRGQADLGQVPGLAQLRADGAQPVAAGEFVAAVAADESDLAAAGRVGERWGAG